MRTCSVATARVFAALAFAGVAAALLSGCSATGDYPTVLDRPPPRDDVTLTPAQVKQATDDLITERDHLCSEVQAGNGTRSAGAAPCASAYAPTGSAQPTGSAVRP